MLRRRLVFIGFLTLASLGVATLVVRARSVAEDGAARDRLAKALATEDLDAVRACVADARRKAGEGAGVPEVDDVFQPIPKDGTWLTAAEAGAAIDAMPRRIDALRWWKIGLDPTTLEHPLREAASVVSGCVHASRVRPEAAVALLERAREAAEFLMWAQRRAGTGVYPFPAVRGDFQGAALAAADRFLRRAEKEGRLAEVVRNGWAFEDGGDGGLQFDNGEAGVAMFEIYEATKERKYLDSAVRAADWAAARPLVPNWNYNAFSVSLLVKASSMTGEAKYLAAAVKKARIGVIPGQLTDGPNAGRWIDPHNARPAYHYILLRGLAALTTVLPADDATRAEVIRALRLGLTARNQDFLDRGAPTKEMALSVLLLVDRALANDADVLRDTRSKEALDALGRLVSGQARRGQEPLGPRAWGEFLEEAVRRATR